MERLTPLATEVFTITNRAENSVPDQFRHVAMEQIWALQLLYKAGCLHRDFKNEHFMIRTSDWQLVLVDFGLCEVKKEGRMYHN